MNDERSFERTARAWLELGANQAPDRAVQAVLLAIETTPQERDLRIPWRFPRMNKLVAIGLGTAAVVVALFVGAQLLGPPAPSGVGGAPSTAPSPTASRTPAPSLAAPSASAEPGLPVGSSYVLINEGGVRGTVTVPAPGWFGDGGIMAKNDVDPPDGAGMITFTGYELYVYGDPCNWSATKAETPSRTVDELVAALSAQASRDASAPVDVTVDGHAGKSITLHVPDDAVFSKCDEGYFGSWGGPEEPTPYRYHQGPGQIDEVWILDVDGVLAVIDTGYYVGTPVEHVEEMRAIVESTTFE